MMIETAFNNSDPDHVRTRDIRTRSAILIVGVMLGCLACARKGWSEDADPRSHWAFRPLQHHAVPVAGTEDPVASPLDAFVAQKLRAVSLEQAAAADKRTLIRRASFDLIGLPPTSAAVAEFLQDESPDAFERLIDRLLASPHYGERWGRHWLDLARYANTLGDTGGKTESPYAYTYRDYVIRSLNSDLPYDQFLIEQIAADRLGNAPDSPSLAALGFLTVGRRFLGDIHDIIDDRIDVVTRGLMALTVNCARCHDHKYDPIPTKDYYGLYGVFANSREPSPLPEIGAADPSATAEYQSLRNSAETSRAEVIREESADSLKRYRKRTASYLMASLKIDPATAGDDNATDGNRKEWGPRRWRKALEKLNRETDPIFAPWFAFVALPESEFKERARELAEAIAMTRWTRPVNPIVARAFAGDPPATLDAVAERYGRLVEEAAQPDAPNATTTPETAALGELRKALVLGDAPGNLPELQLREWFRRGATQQLNRLETELAELAQQHRGAPLRAMALYDNPQPTTPRVFIRGNANNPGEEVPRQLIEILSAPNRQPFSNGSGRLELARAIANRDNPLTARVLVNRVWMHHFGEGLVTTPDDFGSRADPPSHAGLLDNLALQFMERGWSLKTLHRALMQSHTYRLSSDDGLRSELVDPGNRLLSKMNRRRLDFESMRDTLLFVAGHLDQTMRGPAEFLSPQPHVALGGGFTNSGDQRPTHRRAVYGLIDRQNLPGILRAFDFADPDTCTGRRYVTTVPQQALYFFNNPFVMEQACGLASTADSLDGPEERIGELYQRLFQRSPTDIERELAVRFIAREEAAPAPVPGVTDASQRLSPWERLAHVLLISDEMLFVD